MSIGLLGRIKSLVVADAHAVVESLEDRPVLLKQCLREAELELDRKRARVDALAEEEKRLRDELERCEGRIRSLDEDIRLALAGDKDELARFAIRKLLPHRKQLEALAGQLGPRELERRELEAKLEEQAEQFESLKTRVRAELRARAAEPEGRGWLGEPPVADEEVELELLRRKTGAGEGA